MKRIAIIGAGSWGTALGVMAGKAGHNVSLWSRSLEIVESINRDHRNSRYLSSTAIPPHVRAYSEVDEVVREAEIVVLAVPSHAMRTTMAAIAFALPMRTLLVSATKGIEAESGKRMSEVVSELVDPEAGIRFVCLSGPSFAKEVVAGHPTAIVAASKNEDDSRAVQAAFSFENLRVYTNADLIGVELGGSVKNVVAIAAGMVAGLGFGANSIAALVTRGLAEIYRLALHEGAKAETLMGLAGLGDLVLTCTGTLSRNRFVGQELGRGRNLAEIGAEMNEVAEGVITTKAVYHMASRSGIEMPISREVYAVLYDGKHPRAAVTELMTRPLKNEFEG